MLEFYVRDFDSVEINNSFYHLPTPGTLETWGRTTPDNLCFSVKGSRFMTHQKKLTDPDKILERFIPFVDRLGPKLGPILFQLPPRWHCNVERLTAFLEALPLGIATVSNFETRAGIPPRGIVCCGFTMQHSVSMSWGDFERQGWSRPTSSMSAYTDRVSDIRASIP